MHDIMADHQKFTESTIDKGLSQEQMSAEIPLVDSGLGKESSGLIRPEESGIAQKHSGMHMVHMHVPPPDYSEYELAQEESGEQSGMHMEPQSECAEILTQIVLPFRESSTYPGSSQSLEVRSTSESVQESSQSSGNSIVVPLFSQSVYSRYFLEGAEFNIPPGTDTVGETRLIISEKSYFEWKGYGLKLHIPENVLPQEVDQCTLNIRALRSGQFELPPEHILASAVYQIKASVKLARPVILEIQHCCSFENSDSTSLCFVVARTKSELPYKFQKLEGGIFSSNYSYGSISLDHFCFLGIVTRWFDALYSLIMRPVSPLLYCAHLYHICQQNTTDWRLHFGITKDLDLHITVMREKLKEGCHDAQVLEANKFSIQFEEDEITLSIPECEEIEGWEISCLHHPIIITKAAVDAGSALGCRFYIRWMKQQRPVHFKYKVFLKGAKPSRSYFIVYPPLQVVAKPTPPPTEGHSVSSTASETTPLDSGKQTTQYKNVAAKRDLIISTLSPTVSAERLVDKLEGKELIGDDVRSKARGEREDKNKIRTIMEAVLVKIELNSANYDKFIETLREFGDQEDLIECIESAT